ncbi:MAG: tetratricopeptide repeat protein [Acidobacteriota bacterium]|nr:tetratricopeptide repeat protein [Acidobacteriota bacterium]
MLAVYFLHAADSRLADGKRAFAAGRYEDAARLLGQARDDPGACEAAFYRGLAHYRLKQLDQAIIDLQSAIQCAPGNPDSFVVLAAAYSDKGNDDRAVAAFDAALELQPSNVQALRAAATLDLRHERNERAITKLEKLVVLDRNDAQAHSDLGAAYAGTSSLARAREQFEQALKLRPGTASALVGLGNVFLKTGHIEEALGKLTEAVKAEPRAYEPHFLLASAYNTLGRYSEALGECNEALRLGGTDSEVYYHLARAYRGLERPEDARKALERFSALRSQSGREVEGRREAARLMTQAKPLVDEGRLPEAIALLERAIGLDGKNPRVLFRLAGLYYDTRQFDRARHNIQAAIDLAPSEYLYHYLSGLVEKDSGKLDAARARFETAIRLNPSAADGFNQLGDLAMSRRSFAEAIQYFEKATRLDPADPAYRLNLQVATEAKGGSVKQAVLPP